MSRSSKKGPYTDEKLLKKIVSQGDNRRITIKVWSRSSVVSPEMIGKVLDVHNGKAFVSVLINENMVGHKLGEFAPTRRFTGHSGKNK